MVETAGPTRESSGEKVSPEEARAAWTVAARPVLLDAAQRYGHLVTHKQLAEAVQRDADVRTTQQSQHWIGKVLVAVAEECHQKGEPLLSAFCVHADESVGPRYAGAVLEAYGFTPDDPDMHAAEERFKAHVFFGAKVPADGGGPKLPPKIARQRARIKAAIPRPTRPMCPNCFVEMPVVGPCGFCAE